MHLSSGQSTNMSAIFRALHRSIARIPHVRSRFDDLHPWLDRWSRRWAHAQSWGETRLCRLGSAGRLDWETSVLSERGFDPKSWWWISNYSEYSLYIDLLPFRNGMAWRSWPKEGKGRDWNTYRLKFNIGVFNWENGVDTNFSVCLHTDLGLEN